MLKDEGIRIDVGWSGPGRGDFMRMIHVPSGITRMHPGPLAGVNRDELRRGWLAEIESELVSKGLTQYTIAEK